MSRPIGTVRSSSTSAERKAAPPRLRRVDRPTAQSRHPAALKRPRVLWQAPLIAGAAVVLITGLATALAFLVIELLAGATAYVTGEGHWSRSHLRAVAALEHYARDGEPADLRAARAALRVPMGDRRARLALEATPPDLEEATSGFLEGLNAEDDIPRMIWFHRHLSSAPYVGEAFAAWKAGDERIVQLVQIADELERYWQEPAAGDSGQRFLSRIESLNRELDPLERHFSSTLLAGSQWLRRTLVLASAIAFAVMAGLSLFVYRWSLRRVRETESRYRAAFQEATVGMAKLRSSGRVVAVNRALGRLLGIDPESLYGLRFRHFLYDQAAAANGAWLKLDQAIECELVRDDGTVFWARLTASALSKARRTDASVFLIVEDVSESHRLRERLAHQATHDALTGLISRREIERLLEQVVASAQQDSQRHTLCFLDLDEFKLVNDTCSHLAGDHLLRLVASTLVGQLRSDDWVGRLGGDEFAVLLRDTPIDAGLAIAQSLNRSLSATSLLWEGKQFALTSSVGLVEINDQTPGVAWALRAADTACHVAKANGRNHVRLYVESDVEVTHRRVEMDLANDLRAAIAEGRIRLYAQRIVPTQAGADAMGTCYELLVRVIGSDGRVITPGVYLAAAEHFSMATMIDKTVLGMCFDLLGRFLPVLGDVECFHINISGQSAMSTEFREYAAALLAENPETARRLCFELTETSPIDRMQDARTFIEMVHRHGCRIALDDFGSGLSTFAYLKNFPVDIIKIDGLFIRDIVDDPKDQAVVRAVTEVCRSLGKRVIAEWVQSEEALACLRGIGVDGAQGNAIHRPCPLEDVIDEYQFALNGGLRVFSRGPEERHFRR